MYVWDIVALSNACNSNSHTQKCSKTIGHSKAVADEGQHLLSQVQMQNTKSLLQVFHDGWLDVNVKASKQIL